MAKETQKEKIERLERELSQAQEVIKEQNNKIDSMVDKADNSFENSVTYKQMQKQIEDLELKLKVSNDSIEHNRHMYNAELKRNSDLIKDIQQLKNENKAAQKVHNERGAGRKARFTDSQIKDIQQYREDGKTIKEISYMFKCSVGLIHKLISEHKE